MAYGRETMTQLCSECRRATDSRRCGTCWADRTGQYRPLLLVCKRCSLTFSVDSLFERMRARGYGLEFAALFQYPTSGRET